MIRLGTGVLSILRIAGVFLLQVDNRRYQLGIEEKRVASLFLRLCFLVAHNYACDSTIFTSGFCNRISTGIWGPLAPADQVAASPDETDAGFLMLADHYFP